MTRKKRDPNTPKTPRGRKKPLDTTFAAKVRIETVTEKHMHQLATLKRVKRREITRNDMKQYLTEACMGALQVLDRVEITLPSTASAASGAVSAPAPAAGADSLLD